MRYVEEPAQRIGWLFVLATVAGVLSVVVMGSTLGEEELLAAVRADQGSLLLGEMLVLVMLVAMVGTAVLLWPVLRPLSETLALGYVLARTLEVATITIGLVAGLLLIPLGWSAGGGPEPVGAELMAEMLRNASDWAGYVGAQMVFSISALVLNWAFLRHGLLPRWLALWGLVGVPLMFLSGLLVMVESLDASASTLNLLVVPLAVQEMAMAAWLIVRGFDRRTDRESVSEAAPALGA